MPCNCGRNVGLHNHLGDVGMREGGFGIGTPLNNCVDLAFIQLWNSKNTPNEAERIFSPKTPDNNDPISSDGDPELLILVPLSAVCRIKGVSILGPVSSAAPSKVKIFANPVEVSGFDSIRRLIPQEEIELSQLGGDDRIVYKLNPVKFLNVSRLVFFFEHSFDEEETEVLRIDLFGENSGKPTHDQVATNLVYEGRPNPADHQEVEEKEAVCSHQEV
ncbi:hypothetical protein STCU_07161 [Strigomonas culicis]|uniref:PITH domain-containing protein n=1 Tax=Strigomonas culicis TaxID=28005 RepID=S9VBT4_9TRYP|nr:hypothetical protein STCU_07161 [Strigomonas culicis]|eukprot:EPY24476.1 hypothetical protein STCU_07161 [Strigomonas culicis]